MSVMTCLICPNGCGLSYREKDGVCYIRGNRCLRGVGFAEKVLIEKGIPGPFRSEKPFLRYSEEEIAALLARWDLPLTSLEENRFIQGSPERSLYRTSLLSGERRLILEQITPERAEKNENTALRLEHMKEGGLPVLPFLRGKDGRASQEEGGHYWRLLPFARGISLNRSAYPGDEWRGKALGQFLCRLYSLEKPDPDEQTFSLTGFINGLIEKISLHHTDLLMPLNPILHRLEERIFPLYDQIPAVFGHGDPHPLNVIWGEEEIKAVIDWEFSGTKPILYDAALIMGCVGSEAPEAFDSPFNRAFYREIASVIPPEWLALLPDFILAQRFAWLNEWLRHEDEAMVSQELRYMEMLL